MPTRKPKLNKEEQRKYWTLISRLRAAGVITGTAGELPSTPKRLDLRQLEYPFCRVHDLPGEQVVLILLCKLMALRAGATVRDCAISLPWGPELDLCDPGDTPYYDDLVHGWPEWPPKVLNRWLTGEVSLPRGRTLTGIIIATGWVRVPADYRDESPVDVELVVSDDQDNQLEFRLKAGLDRSVKRADERKRQMRAKAQGSTERVRLFKHGETETRVEAPTA